MIKIIILFLLISIINFDLHNLILNPDIISKIKHQPNNMPKWFILRIDRIIISIIILITDSDHNNRPHIFLLSLIYFINNRIRDSNEILIISRTSGNKNNSRTILIIKTLLNNSQQSSFTIMINLIIRQQ
jgi:hypothetical protein